MEYRHELKFIVRDTDLELLRARIAHIAKPDAHQPDEQGYIISSLYFDDMHNHCANDTIGGYDHRHKYRIRIYEHSQDIIKLERKSKIHGMTAKKSVSISAEECKMMMDGYLPKVKGDYSEIKKQILCEMKLLGMRPKCIVQYQRQAFVYDVGNVRITFDRNISGSREIQNFLDDYISVIPLLSTGMHVLEVKYDNLLPKYLADALEIESLMQSSFSKYGYARNQLG